LAVVLASEAGWFARVVWFTSITVD